MTINVSEGTTAGPDAIAVQRILAVDPVLHRVERASEALGLRRNELLHAGPPMTDPGTVCRPILHSAITAILFEGWADSLEEAERLLHSGMVRLRPAQDVNCVVPLADVVSPSMWLQGVDDVRFSEVSWSPLNGGSERVLRVGVLGSDVLEHLRWINGSFATVLARALRKPVSLLEIADRGLAGGDDCHGRTSVATAALVEILEQRLSGSEAGSCRAFLRQAPSFFLNIWMASSKLMLDAARGVNGSSIITAAGGNGFEFGIQVASNPATWFTARATPPVLAGDQVTAGAESLGAIGDSAVVDFLGLGAMTTPAQVVKARHVFPESFRVAAEAPRKLLLALHPSFGRTRPFMVTSAQRVIDVGQAPIVSLGVLDKGGRLGRLGGGYYRPPLEIFAHAIANLER